MQTLVRWVGSRSFLHPRDDLPQGNRTPIPAIHADVEAGPGGRNAAVGVPVDVEVAVPGVGPRHVRVVACPQRLAPGHSRVLNEDPLDVDDGSGPFEPIPEAEIVVAPDQMDAAVEARPDGRGVVQGAPVGEVTEVPDDVVRSDGLVPGGDQCLVMGLDARERTRSRHAGTEQAPMSEVGVGADKRSWHGSRRIDGGQGTRHSEVRGVGEGPWISSVVRSWCEVSIAPPA